MHSFSKRINVILRLLSFIFVIFCLQNGKGQNFISWNYTGPDTILVGANCRSTLDWGGDSRVIASPTQTGQTITSKSLLSISGNYSQGSFVNAGVVITVTYQATDNLGHTETFQFKIYFVDKTPPVFNTSSLPLKDITVSCLANLPYPPVSATDNCTAAFQIVISVTNNFPSSPCEGNFQRTWTATDQAGNFSKFVQNITLQKDIISPIIMTPASNIEVNCNPAQALEAFNVWINNNGGAEASDNCTLGTWTTIPSQPTIQPNCLEPTEVTFVATDLCGNKANTTATFTLNDDEAPNFESGSQDLLLECSDNINIEFIDWLDHNGNAVISDNCGSSTFTVEYEYDGKIKTKEELLEIIQLSLNGQCVSGIIDGQLETNLRVRLPIYFLATDLCGNQSISLAFFGVRDSQTPIITHNGDSITNFECGLTQLPNSITSWYENGANATGQDDCEVVIWEGRPALNSLLQQISQSGKNCNQSYNVYFRAKDICGKLSLDSFKSQIIIIDTLGPIIPVIDDYQLICFADGVNDSIKSWINIVGKTKTTDCNNSSASHFTWKNNSGQSGEGNFNIGPYPNINGSECGQFFDFIFYFKDQCDNLSFRTAKYNIGDIDPPIALSVPNDTTIICGAGFSLLPPQFEDNCFLDGDVLVQIESTQDDDHNKCAHFNFQNTVTWIASDFCGNSTSVTQIITFIDTIPPHAIGEIKDYNISCNDPMPGIFENFEDNCSNITITLTELSTQGTEENECEYYNYTVNRNYSISDICGNTTNFLQRIFVRDVDAPIFIGEDTITTNCIDSSQMVQFLSNMILDDCSSVNDKNFTLIGKEPYNLCTVGGIQIWQISAKDICENILNKQIAIIIDDQTPPIIQDSAKLFSVSCSSDFNNLFQSYIDNYGNSFAIEACSNLHVFAALPGSYDLNDRSTFPGIKPVLNPELNCSNASLAFINIDFVYYDDCGNASVTNGVFEIKDTSAPQIINCPLDKEIKIGGTDCKASVTLNELPLVTDNCATESKDSTFSAEASIISDIPGDNQKVVNPVQIKIGPLSYFQDFATIKPNGLEVILEKIDGDLPTERFMIYGENDQFLGYTNSSNTQCGQSVTTLNILTSDFITWTQDNFIEITLIPDTSHLSNGNNGINDICIASKVKINIHTNWIQPIKLKYSYAVDQSNFQNFDVDNLPQLILNEGQHSIQFQISDCGGNIATCTHNISIVDTIKPEITCPDDITLSISNSKCDTTLTIPLPLSQMDNCGFENDINVTLPTTQNEAFLTFEFNSDLNNFLAEDKVFIFKGVEANVTSPVRLNIRAKGNMESGGEFYTFYDENGNVMGNSQSGNPNVPITPHCNLEGLIIFNISANKFNSWAADGSIQFTAVSNKNFLIPPGNQNSGINPCPLSSVTATGQSDSSSYMYMQLLYTSYKAPDYFVSGATIVPLTQIPPPYNPPRVKFNSGLNYFHYIISDRSGNSDTCTFEINIIDSISPKAICRNAIIQIHPSGIIPYTIVPSEINNGSYDNCAIDTMYVIPNKFTCEQIGTQQSVKLFVKDFYGLIDSCETQIKIEEKILSPFYALGVCENDTLQLYPNIVDTTAFNAYVYHWSGPNGFQSNLANPIIPNIDPSYSGTYTLIIEGLNGCKGTGFVEVFINSINQAPILKVDHEQICVGQSSHFSSQFFSGNASYEWYEGVFPNGELLATTNVAVWDQFFDIGQHSIYLIVTEGECTSLPSNLVTLTVGNSFEAIVNEDSIKVCQGGSIILGTPINGSGLVYDWSGPNGFQSSLQYPPAILNASNIHEGDYELIISNNFCISSPAHVNVLVLDHIEAPEISSNSPICTTTTLEFKASIASSVDSFIWKGPSALIYITKDPTLLINNASSLHSGFWEVYAKNGNCISEASAKIEVFIQDSFKIIISTSGPVCHGDSTRLFVETIQGATYKWTGPNGFNSQIQNPKIKALPGIYRLEVETKSGCIGSSEISLELLQKPVISDLTTNAINCQHPDDTVQFNFNTFLPIDQLNFTWIGPNGFQSTIPKPKLSGNFINGVYKVVAKSQEGCISDTAYITLQIIFAPEKPILIEPNPVCSGQTLTIEIENFVSGEFTWFTPTGEVTTFTNKLVINNIQSNQQGEYSVNIFSNNCLSKNSLPLNITVIQTPDRPNIVGQSMVCLGDSILLNPSPSHIEYNYTWTGPNGLASESPLWIIYPASQQNTGIYTLIATNEGCSSSTSLEFNLKVNDPPTTPTIKILESSICAAEQGAQITICIDDNSATTNASYSFYLDNQTKISGPTLGICSIINDFSAFVNGNNVIYATATLNGCESSFSLPRNIQIIYPPEEIAETLEQNVICAGNATVLFAKKPTIASGKWSILNGSATILNPDRETVEVINMQTGKNTFIWQLSFENCENYSSDTVDIYVFDTLAAVDDFFNASGQSTYNFDITQNDLSNIPFQVQIVNDPLHGNAVIDNGNILNYIPNNSSISFDQLEYEICVIGCPQICETALVSLDLDQIDNCNVPNIITPNGDGINDVVKIPCIKQGAQNQSKFYVFNEWGTQVYEKSPYTNDFDGTFENKPLPDGTYYYVFKLDNSTDIQKGFLIIKK